MRGKRCSGVRFCHQSLLPTESKINYFQVYYRIEKLKSLFIKFITDSFIAKMPQ